MGVKNKMEAQVKTWNVDKNMKIVEVEMATLADLVLAADGKRVLQYSNKHFFIDANGVMYSFQ